MQEQALEVDLFFDELHAYLKARFRYKKAMGKVNALNHKTISIDRSRVSMYLRYKSGYHNESQLVIARLAFKEQRQGHGSDLLRFLCTVSGRYGIRSIALEQTNINSSAFASRLGFKEVVEKYWVISTEALAAELSKRPVMSA
ncbi:hypothetical protein CWB99_13550 [Pseudoalteromonas rubra]|uniref:N-acetyltransferase domain-containing protein n=1 Tax=Pseudoalteromonas rubra TaxID=43658 RepID=A0A5S3WM51_9GAMM|nr:hypothetical protein [Pseudoalteromonas rubra]TMP27713.1 hypothetical protein CWB99_13550 [Pseudoalteromonas rubra]TMP32441.1 hypothetical protein CWC00_12200 [Pseudoalteromonas rubra]